jgi:hypothetical protein
MNTHKPINLSKDFQVYEGSELVKSCKTLAEARRQLAACSISAVIVYPSWAVPDKFTDLRELRVRPLKLPRYENPARPRIGETCED